MWDAYQNIRDIGGCKKCGSFERSDGCTLKIDYVYGCDHHTSKMAVMNLMEAPNSTQSVSIDQLGPGVVYGS